MTPPIKMGKLAITTNLLIMRHSNPIYIFILLTLLINCSSIKVTADQEQNTDLSQYKTYSFLGWQKDSDKILTKVDKKRIYDAFNSEFQKRGLKFVQKGGDMAVSLYFVINEETSTTAYTNYYNSFGGRYGGRYNNGWGGGYKATDYNKKDYLKGTLVMDVFNAKDGEQIWQAISKSILNEKTKKREKSIFKAIDALMKKFPIESRSAK